MDTNRRTLVFEQKRDGWIGYAPELPGSYVQGSTLEEVREKLSEALWLASQADRDQVCRAARAKDMPAVAQR